MTTEHDQSLYWYAELLNYKNEPKPAKFYTMPETKNVDGKLRLSRKDVTGNIIQNIHNIPKFMENASLETLFEYFNMPAEEPIPEASKTPVSFTYTNHKGITTIRDVIVHSFYFGSTDWHKDEQWLMHGYDVDKREDRTFALKDCDFLSMTTL